MGSYYSTLSLRLKAPIENIFDKPKSVHSCKQK